MKKSTAKNAIPKLGLPKGKETVNQANKMKEPKAPTKQPLKTIIKKK